MATEQQTGGPAREEQESRWRERRGLARLVRFLIWLGPVLLGVVVATVVANLLPLPEGIGWTIGWWVVVLAAATGAVYVADRYARRLLPVAALLRMSLVFPDRAPPRFRVARTAGRTSELEALVEKARAAGQSDDRAEAAENILSLVAALNEHDRRTRGHSERVRVYSDLLGEEMKLSVADRDRLRWAALLHDVGKITVPHEILNKAGKPTEDEWAVLRSHPDEGAKLLGPLRSWLGPWAAAVREHHERWDGDGYPRGLDSKRISTGGRIVAVADAYETMLAARAYKKPMTAEAARQEVARSAGSHFDPKVVRALMDISIGKLRRTAGPVAWLAQFPFTLRVWDATSPLLQGLSNVGGQIGTIGATVAATAGLALGAVLPAASPGTLEPRRPSESRSVALDDDDPTSRADASPTALPPGVTPSPPGQTPLPPGVTPGPAGPGQTVAPGAVPRTTPRPTNPPPTPTTRPPAGSTELALYMAASAQEQDTTSTGKSLDLRSSAPSQQTLYNYDKNRNEHEGLTIQRSSDGFSESDTKKRQDWMMRLQGDLRLDGPIRLTFWSALKDFKPGRGKLLARVVSCPDQSAACGDVLSEWTFEIQDWSNGRDTWVEHTIEFAAVTRTIPAGRWLGFRLVVDGNNAGSADDMWFAYDTTSYASRLRVFRR